ncbi:long-chain-fatty-acid--CoA ligase [Pseudomonas sp. RGM2987]|uniref:long-chain-fatty-acid--CoA ligase n=1 Tax=Pseudomonas sp. RGM2987 TaxID=2930090 RepID=UPI001FD6F5BA|nr:long-chain-fatty-acid--CoA ligase [Pseudomonas sp. RGM2987]MCJ8206414.1 long-chain-fatty-acid--CoA ligase [Pseudomonas sp. RGM2987]
MAELTLANVARATAKTRPDQTALVFGDRKTSVHELDYRANQVANGLMSLGVTDQERIAILDNSSDQFYEIWLGSARANLVLTPLNSRLSAPEVLQVLSDCLPRVLFVGPSFEGLIEEIKTQLTFVEHFFVTGSAYARWRDEHSAIAVESKMLPSDDCLQIYTSGTTGTPKGVRLTSDNLFLAPLSSLTTGERSPCGDISSDDVVLLCLPHAHVAGAMLGIYGLAMGSRVIVTSEFVPAEIAATIDKEHVTLTLMVPVMIRGLLAAMEKTGLACKSLKTILYGAAPMATSLLRHAMEALPNSGFGQLYGLTETSGPITYLSPEDHHSIVSGNADLALSCGAATASVELRVVDPYGLPLPPGEIGEITCRSSQVMKGYWKRPTETLAAIQDGWFYTGDMGYLDASGYLFIYDRKRDMIITGGENVYPAEVENILYSHPAIQDVAIIGVPDEQWGEAVKAVAVLKPDAVLTSDELIAYVKGKVASFKVPKTVDFASDLPRNATGKVLRRLIREPYWNAQGRGVA